ncbi:HD domain-containing protein [Candidatus Uhrbacteria bacterium]|nr:HD domain-containing protein [Candidatus Uhrbacteria bacterium]
MAFPKNFYELSAQEQRWERCIAGYVPSVRAQLSAARAFAERAHRGQTRKGDPQVPYLIHPIRVACALMEECDVHDPEIIMAALLHDVVEDCGVSVDALRREFGAQVSDLVASLTFPRDRMAMWGQASALVRASESVRMIKAADLVDNMRDLAMTPSIPRSAVMRSMYGYERWGRAIVRTLPPIFLSQFEEASGAIRAVHGADQGVPPLAANPEKSLRIMLADGQLVDRYPVRTHIVQASDDMLALIRQYVVPHLQWGDLLAISERIVAITQGRAYPLAEIRPSRWARLLVRFVHKSKYGIGLGSPWTMELAIREAGLPRMLIAACAAAVTKPFGLRGVFYRVVGNHINAIDGPCDYTLPPYNGYAKLGPKDPDGVAQRLAREIGVDVAIIDANDLGVNVLGASDNVDRAFVAAAFRDNPLGQTREQTPMAIVRHAS